MQKRNLFIVASPLQFLNAIEAKEAFKTNNNVLILMYNTNLNATDANQKSTLLHQEDWDEIIQYDLGSVHKNKRFFYQVRLIKSLLKFQYDYIFSGSFGTMHQVILANLKPQHIYLIDDGNATIFTYEQVKDNKYFSTLSFSRKARVLRFLLVNLKWKINQDINFFTSFNIQPLKNSKVVYHDFTYLKSNKLRECKNDNHIYLLGQNLADIGIMSKNIYLNYIEKIMKHNDEKIIYIPHRSEEIDDRYNYLISDSFKIEVSEGPIESVFIAKNIYPKIIISFVSSALYNLDRIFDKAEVYAIKINPEDLLIKKDLVQKCYDFFDNTGVSVIELS